MSIEAELREEFDRWERREYAVINVLPYLLLAASTVVTLLQRIWGAQMHLPAVLGLTLATTIWVVWFHTRPQWHQDGPLMGLYYAGLMVLGGSLVALAPWYGIFTFVGYVHAFLLLRGRWRYVGVAATSMVQAVSYVGGLDRIRADGWWEWVVVALVTMVLAGAFFHFADMGHQRNHQQQRALVELHEANVKLEEAMAENAGLHAQLLVQAREAGVLDERQRMAREIHDTLAQGLAGIITQLQAAEQSPDEPAVSRRHVTNAINLARESLTEARRTVHAVGPAMLAEARLPDAIGDVTRRWSEAHHIDAMLTTTGDPRPMHADVEVTLLRAAQEALTNVAKHAKASRVGLTLSYMEDLVTLDVRDDGVGFEPDARRVNGSTTGGFGLAGMRQRVQRLAGRLDIESEPGGGTAISATVPAIPAGARS
ncbi:sensor histidine kinase [Polymorphospora lycopeni]|uniref:Oxygen sensor histidine kinase NreB n=1 Tax=Polymorphospora lycopeni TaxID=3140240 RepID=A0ABV5D047_9ACTN